MTFKKILQSDHPIVIGSSTGDELKFPPGFSYRIGGTIYTVKADVTQDITSPMREVILSDGKTEIIPVDSIKRDLREPDCSVLEPDQRYAIKPPVVEEKKVAKKKVTKKKVAKKKKND